jgi:serine protease Do
VTIGSLSDARLAPATARNAPATRVQGRLGVTVHTLTPQEKNGTSLTHGLVVERASGAAANAGIQPGDVILAVNGHPVSDMQQFAQMVARAGKSLALLIERGGSQIFVPIDLE